MGGSEQTEDTGFEPHTTIARVTPSLVRVGKSNRGANPLCLLDHQLFLSNFALDQGCSFSLRALAISPALGM